MIVHELSSLIFITCLCLLPTPCFSSDEGGGWRRPGGHSRGRVRVKRQLVNADTVELLVVVDKQAYDRFLARNGNNATASVEEIQRYLAGLVKETNERLANVDTALLSLRASLASIVTLTTVAESVVSENNKLNASTVLADVALPAFTPVAQLLESTNRHDMAVYITGYDLVRSDLVAADGRTYFKSICSGRKQAIITDFGVERTAVALARMIALAVGANIDGSATQSPLQCSDEFYVMSQAFSVPPRTFQTNPFNFSSCSATEIAAFLIPATLFTQCLRTQEESSPLDVAALTAVELGQTYNADTQCAQRFGVGSTFCREQYALGASFTFDLDLCHDMRCLLPGTATCQGTLPFDGTSCGDQKWCQDGICTANSSAPNTNIPTCPQGDQPNITCLVALCSTSPLYRDYLCCQTCNPSPTDSPPILGTQSIAGVTVRTTQASGPGGLSVAGVTVTAATNPIVGLSVAGVAGTTAGPPGGVSVSIDRTGPTNAPGVVSLSINGVNPTAAPPGVVSLSINGVNPTAAPPGVVSLSINGINPTAAPPGGVTLSIDGVAPTGSPTGPPGSATVSLPLGGGVTLSLGGAGGTGTTAAGGPTTAPVVASVAGGGGAATTVAATLSLGADAGPAAAPTTTLPPIAGDNEQTQL